MRIAVNTAIVTLSGQEKALGNVAQSADRIYRG